MLRQSCHVKYIGGVANYRCHVMKDMSVDLKQYVVELDEPFSTIEAGRGVYGAVYKSKLNGAKCVVKKLHDILTGSGGYECVSGNEWSELVAKFKQEIELLSQQRHPNIVQFLGVCGLEGDPRNICLVMEQLDTDLKGFIEANKGSISFPLKLRILRDVSCGVGHLHASDIVHRDLNAGNVLLTTSLQAKVADLGVSRVIGSRPQYLASFTRVPGALDYMPPEVLRPDPVYGTKMDSFSFGHLALYLTIEIYPYVKELLTSDIDLRTGQDGQLLLCLQIQKRKQWMAMLSKEEVNRPMECLITACLDDSEGKRPSMRELREQLEAMMSQHESVPSMTEWKLMNEEKEHKIEQLTTEMEEKIQEMTQLEIMKDKEIFQLSEDLQRQNTFFQEELQRTTEEGNHYKALLSELRKEKKLFLLLAEETSLAEVTVSYIKMKIENSQMKDIIASGQQQMRACKQEMDDLKEELRKGQDMPSQDIQNKPTAETDFLEIDLDEFKAPPDYATQKEKMKPLLQQKLKQGDKWYLIDQRWFKQWKKYTGYDSWDQQHAGSESVMPGPVDNSNLLEDPANNIIKDYLQEELDYTLLPKPAWEMFVLWYSITPQSQPICRRVVEYGTYVKHLKVEVYLITVKVCVHPHINDTKQILLSRADTIKIVRDKLRKLFEILDDSETRLWQRYMTNSYELMKDPNQSVADSGIYGGQILMLEAKNKEGKWTRDSASTSSYGSSTGSQC